MWALFFNECGNKNKNKGIVCWSKLNVIFVLHIHNIYLYTLTNVKEQ